MRKLFLTVLVLVLTAVGALGQTQGAPTLTVKTEDPSLPSELFYGNTRVKPLRLRPGTNTPITIDDADFFVQQQYVDFLSRFPDQNGFQFWLNEIASCAGNASCIDAKRTNTSGAFFLSIEFQNTGFFVYRLYKASFNKLPLYQNFMPETRQVSKGLIVLAPGWQQVLEANKQSFANGWVGRADFLAEYPTSMTPAAYVDKLIQTAGLAPAQVDRDTLVADLSANRETRATVLRKIIESNAFTAQEKNRAFVQMQYFGYMRRDPDEAGLNFWLKKLNDHGGDFVGAEMVRSFLVSSEYKDRF